MLTILERYKGYTEWLKFKILGERKDERIVKEEIKKVPIFIISLIRRKDRLEKMLENIKWRKIFIVNAVDGNKIRKNSSKIKKNELGCYLSHYNVYKFCKEKRYNRILCLEDDCMIKLPDLWNEISFYVKKTPKNFDALFIGYSFVKDEIQTNEYINRLNGEIHGTHAILWSKKGLRKIVRILENKKINYPIDVLLGKLSKSLEIYITNKPVVHVNNYFDSDIQWTES